VVSGDAQIGLSPASLRSSAPYKKGAIADRRAEITGMDSFW
jgi:hypothetical protein